MFALRGSLPWAFMKILLDGSCDTAVCYPVQTTREGNYIVTILIFDENHLILRYISYQVFLSDSAYLRRRRVIIFVRWEASRRAAAWGKEFYTLAQKQVPAGSEAESLS